MTVLYVRKRPETDMERAKQRVHVRKQFQTDMERAKLRVYVRKQLRTDMEHTKQRVHVRKRPETGMEPQIQRCMSENRLQWTWGKNRVGIKKGEKGEGLICENIFLNLKIIVFRI